jgi:alpha/beta superfamily hydrolase
LDGARYSLLAAIDHPMTGSRGPSAASRIVQLTLPGPAGDLEALLQTGTTTTPGLASLALHPHPQHGGTMHNKVVHRVAGTLAELGSVVLRFNFRGVGKSAGSYGGGPGEVEDARAALRYLYAQVQVSRLWVAGFSFGAGIAVRLAADAHGIERLVLVAPPVQRADLSMLRSSPAPKLVIQGTADRVCPREALEAQFATWSEPKRLVLVEGASHFFDGKLSQLAQVLVQELSGPGGGVASETT